MITIFFIHYLSPISLSFHNISPFPFPQESLIKCEQTPYSQSLQDEEEYIPFSINKMELRPIIHSLLQEIPL
jgi:hypothetical protein